MNLKLESLTKNSSEFAKVEDLYYGSFPQNERPLLLGEIYDLKKEIHSYEIFKEVSDALFE